ncbi:MAG TPA: hypothetical protein VGC56_06220 [Allosphingosinicella sp.]|jgi:hypothetical protein
MRRLVALAMMLAAAGCVSQQPAAAPPVRRVQAPPPPAEVHYSPQGLENVIGRTAAYLAAEFGEPDLDIREGPARKLQYSRPACVLDAYLYPPKAGGDPIVTWIDTRLPDGRDANRVSCVTALLEARRR